MMTDPIADMLTRIRNAARVRKREVLVPHSRVKFAIAQILAREGYLETVEKTRSKLGAFDELKITLKYRDGNDGVIQSVTRISTPSRRLYFGYRDMPSPSGRGLLIVSTPKGLMTHREARKGKVGGEVVCEVY